MPLSFTLKSHLEANKIIVQIFTMLKMFFYQNVAVGDLFISASAGGEIELLLLEQFLNHPFKTILYHLQYNFKIGD